MIITPTALRDVGGISLAGATSPENNYMLDGLRVGDPSGNYLGSNLLTNFIDQIDVKTSGFLPEYGYSSGGIVNTVIKSGSNEFHGSIWGNLTPGLFSPPSEVVGGNGQAIASYRSPYKGGYESDFGLEVGGPILKDRLWFYAGVAARLDYDVRTGFYRSRVASQEDPESVAARPVRDVRHAGDPGHGDGVRDEVESHLRRGQAQLAREREPQPVPEREHPADDGIRTLEPERIAVRHHERGVLQHHERRPRVRREAPRQAPAPRGQSRMVRLSLCAATVGRGRRGSVRDPPDQLAHPAAAPELQSGRGEPLSVREPSGGNRRFPGLLRPALPNGRPGRVRGEHDAAPRRDRLGDRPLRPRRPAHAEGRGADRPRRVQRYAGNLRRLVLVRLGAVPWPGRPRDRRKLQRLPDVDLRTGRPRKRPPPARSARLRELVHEHRRRPVRQPGWKGPDPVGHQLGPLRQLVEWILPAGHVDHRQRAHPWLRGPPRHAGDGERITGRSTRDAEARRPGQLGATGPGHLGLHRAGAGQGPGELGALLRVGPAADGLRFAVQQPGSHRQLPAVVVRAGDAPRAVVPGQSRGELPQRLRPSGRIGARTQHGGAGPESAHRLRVLRVGGILHTGRSRHPGAVHRPVRRRRAVRGPAGPHGRGGLRRPPAGSRHRGHVVRRWLQLLHREPGRLPALDRHRGAVRGGDLQPETRGRRRPRLGHHLHRRLCTSGEVVRRRDRLG